MQELVKYIVKALADTEDVIVEERAMGGTGVELTVLINKSDIGKIIGKQGRIAKAIRAIVKAAGSKQNLRYTVTIAERNS